LPQTNGIALKFTILPQIQFFLTDFENKKTDFENKGYFFINEKKTENHILWICEKYIQ
jgi:hypothetical protein